MTEKSAFELLLEAINSSSATHSEKVVILDKLQEYIDYKYQQNLNLIR
jgi:hypothetical protein